MNLSFFYAGLDPAAAIFLFLTSFAGSFITVAMGIGGGAMLLAVMATLIPPAALIPVHGVIQFGSNVNRALVMGGHTYWPPIAGFGVGSIIGVGIGGLIVVDLPPSLVQIGVGVFVIWSVARKPPEWVTRSSFVTGAISSFLTMFFGATGVFVAGIVKSYQLGREAHVATQAVLMTLQHLLKIIVFGLLGFVFSPWIGFMAVMIATGFVGTLVGRQVLRRMNDAIFGKALNVILMLLAARLIWQGIAAL
ncbi:MAG: TSUP family transporter [Planktomarina sp.]